MTQIKDAQGEGTGEKESLAVRQTISESTSTLIREALYQSVQEGTGAVAAVDGYTIAGKTGIAEKLPRGVGNYLVSFCGFVPADNPQMLVYIVIDTPHTEDQAHSSYASSMCGRIMADILPDSGL